MADEQKKCARCESGKPAKTYDPRITGKPNKTVNLCDECAGKDPKAVPIDNVVPAIEPAVPETPKEPEKPDIVEFATQEHGPMVSEPISIPTPKNAPPTEPTAENKPVCTEPIDRQVIRDKIVKHEQQLSKLLESRQRVQAQLMQVNQMIDVQKGAIAISRDILGNEG
jgi:hypothetical protein